jgi:hypothetical protein
VRANPGIPLALAAMLLACGLARAAPLELRLPNTPAATPIASWARTHWRRSAHRCCGGCASRGTVLASRGWRISTPSVLDYFRRHGAGGEASAHFQQAFGESIPQFQQALDARMAELLR